MSYSDRRPTTWILDIDGCLVEQHSNINNHGDLTEQLIKEPKLLPGVKEFFLEADARGERIIILTGRKESSREETVTQLKKLGLFWDHLVMGVGGGDRRLVNDNKPDGRITAYAHPIERNKGLEDLRREMWVLNSAN